MNLLYRVIFCNFCTSTHHKLALDALLHLRAPLSARWRNLFLKYYRHYLDGAKDPDTRFKDFRNHVLHVRQGHWGGAVGAAEKWYAELVLRLRERKWREAVYAAGVLSHYYTDPIQPLHTDQSEAENNIHRGVEWSITKSYDAIQELLEVRFGYPEIEVPSGDWLARMVVDGAELAHPHYDTLVKHYDFHRGHRNPPAGLDDTCRELLAKLIGHAIVGYARILDHAFADSHVIPPETYPTVHGLLASLQIPMYWVVRKLTDERDQALVHAIYHELQSSGRVERQLPEDDRAIRDLVAREVGSNTTSQRRDPDTRVTQPDRTDESPDIHGPSEQPIDLSAKRVQRDDHTDATPAADASQLTSVPDDDWEAADNVEPTTAVSSGDDFAPLPSIESAAASRQPPVGSSPRDQSNSERARQTSERTWKYYLSTSSDVVDGPSIGNKTARRLARVRIDTVADLLDADPEQLSDQLRVRHITPETVADWQDQARLVCQIPNLRGHDAQLLVGCDYRDRQQVARADAAQMLARIRPFAESAEGQRILRSGKVPDRQEIQDWIEAAQHGRSLRAA